jgi:hypothetical protein
MNNALLVAMLAALCMCDCAAPPFEERYGKTGVSMEEWAEIRAAIRSITNSPVMLCTRVPEPKPAYQLDEITVSTADGKAYSARKIRGKWAFHEVILVGQTGPSSNQSLQPTATRCVSTFFMIKTVPDIFSRAPGSRG